MKIEDLLKCMSVRSVVDAREALKLAAMGIFTVGQLIAYCKMSEELAETLRENSKVSPQVQASDS